MRKIKGTYKIIVVDFGSYLPYVYKRVFFFWWVFVRVGNLEPLPYYGSTIQLQEEYNVPEKRLLFRFKKPIKS